MLLFALPATLPLFEVLDKTTQSIEIQNIIALLAVRTAVA